MKKILLISQQQFGYHIDSYIYSMYLKKSYEITYLCWDYLKPRILLDNIVVHYISRKGNIVFRNARFIYNAIKLINRINYKTIFLVYFRGASFLKLFTKNNNYILDIRTGSVASTFIRRFTYNKLLLFESFFFSRITIISESLGKYLGINKKKLNLLPLGSDIFSASHKSFKEIKLLYVGAFDHRKLELTINGFYSFFLEFKEDYNIKYTIIGSGSTKEERKLKNLVNALKLNNIIEFLGYIPYDKLNSYFDSHNFGVVFIPIEKKYEYQPPTKLFEYLNSGMPVIATKTYENMQIVDETNGVLIKDSAEEFYLGLKKLLENKKKYNSSTIRKHVEKFTWNNIINEFLFPILEK